MNYAIKFYQNCSALSEADEIIIKYTHKTTELLDFIKEYKEEQRIVIDITQIETIDESNSMIWRAAMEQHKNFAVKLSLYQETYLEIIKENKIPFFFAEGADTWDKLAYITEAGAADVYIVNDFGFDMQNISDFCKQNNIKIRVIPNVVQTSATLENNLDTFKMFYIRPEDVYFYSSFVDTFEFDGLLEKQPVYISIYKEGKWNDDLSLLILGLEKSIQNNTIIPTFAERRSNCRKLCWLKKCHLCDNITSLSQVLTKNNLAIDSKLLGVKNEFEIDETVVNAIFNGIEDINE